MTCRSYYYEKVVKKLWNATLTFYSCTFYYSKPQQGITGQKPFFLLKYVAQFCKADVCKIPL